MISGKGGFFFLDTTIYSLDLLYIQLKTLFLNPVTDLIQVPGHGSHILFTGDTLRVGDIVCIPVRSLLQDKGK